jgi:hypothetical protein
MGEEEWNLQNATDTELFVQHKFTVEFMEVADEDYADMPNVQMLSEALTCEINKRKPFKPYLTIPTPLDYKSLRRVPLTELLLSAVTKAHRYLIKTGREMTDQSFWCTYGAVLATVVDSDRGIRKITISVVATLYQVLTMILLAPDAFVTPGLHPHSCDVFYSCLKNELHALNEL